MSHRRTHKTGVRQAVKLGVGGSALLPLGEAFPAALNEPLLAAPSLPVCVSTAMYLGFYLYLSVIFSVSFPVSSFGMMCRRRQREIQAKKK